jgi:hypothetical protein
VELGQPIRIPKEWFADEVWKNLTTGRTNTLHKAAEDALQLLFGLDH